MQVRAKDGCVYFSASKAVKDAYLTGGFWDVNYVGPSILDSRADFDRLCGSEGLYYYTCGTLDADGVLAIGQFFSRGLGWIIEGGNVRTCIFKTLEGDVRVAINECEKAVPMGG